MKCTEIVEYPNGLKMTAYDAIKSGDFQLADWTCKFCTKTNCNGQNPEW